MNEEDLSPEARQKLKELALSIEPGENWNLAYLDILKGMAKEEIAPREKSEVTGQGVDALRRSHKEYAVEVELKAYAVEFLGSMDISKAVAKLPEVATLDDFLDSIMPDTGREVRRRRFLDFLRHEAEKQLINYPPPPGLNVEEDNAVREWVESQVQARLASLERHQVPALTAYDITQSFRAWWKRTDEGNNLSVGNKEKRVTVDERWNDLVALLPRRNDDGGISKDEWRKRAVNERLFSSSRTFNRDVKAIKDAGLVQVQKDGRFRQKRK